MVDKIETLVFPARRRFQQKRLINPEETRNRSDPRPGVRNSGERRAASQTGDMSYQAPQREVRVASSTPADAHAGHSTSETSAVSDSGAPGRGSRAVRRDGEGCRRRKGALRRDQTASTESGAELCSGLERFGDGCSRLAEAVERASHRFRY